jgi:type IV secretion system protein VirB9
MILAAALCAVPALAHAQQVPAIPPAAANTALPNSDPAVSSANVAAPAGLPPPLHVLSPSAPLTPKERAGVAQARHWATRAIMPHPDEDGIVRFLYGATMPSVVCAPLHVCDLELQPGEIVNNINIGDKARWSITPGLSGGGSGLVTHVMIKPYDAGLSSNLIILTNRRTYSIKLVSEQTEWMPLIGFNYPDEASSQWASYRRTMTAFVGTNSGQPTAESSLQFYCVRPDGAPPNWIPTRAYTDGRRTVIEFPASFSYAAEPALVALAGGGFFSGPAKQVVSYRQSGNSYVVDSVLDRAELVSGVGGDQQSVKLQRGCT